MEKQNEPPVGRLIGTDEPSDWECELFGMGRAIVLRPSKKNAPNWFWRKMQYLCFGNRWVKNK